MSLRTMGLDATLHDYLVAYGVREPDVMRRLRAESDALARADLRSSVEQVNALALILGLMGARRVIEVGVFTGYATLAFARALGREGRVFALDISTEWTGIGRRYWDEAGVAERIDLIIAPALETLDRLRAAGHEGSIDFAYIDADKGNYTAYYEACLALLRPGGLIAVDNVLWSGKVADPAAQDPETAAIRDFNARLRDDPRIELAMLPIGDGVTLARKC